MKKPILLLSILLILRSASAQDPLIQQMVSTVSSDSIWSYITTLSSQQRYSYATSDTECREYLSGFFEQLGFDTVFFQTFQARRTPNIIAELRGDSVPDSVCVIGAHYDSYASNAPGADDNASGTAGVMEVARALAPHHFRYTIRFICFSAEEQGMVGSQYYVQNAVNAGDKIFSMVNIDMISHSATGSEPPVFYLAYNTLSQGLMQKMNQAMLDYVPGANWMNGSNSPYASSSDHSSFWEFGIPAIFINDCLDVNSGNFNHYIHTFNDVVGTSSNNQPLAEACARTAAAVIADLAAPTGEFPVGVAENTAAFDVYPNPADDMITIRTRARLSDVKLLDIQGRTLRQIPLSGAAETCISTADLVPGVYFLIADAGGRTEKRVVVKR